MAQSCKYNKEGRIETISVFSEKQLYLPDHPNADSTGRILEYRLIAATILGKPLPVGAAIHHHHDGTLVICQDKSYHELIHTRMKAFEITGDPNRRRCYLCNQWDDQLNLKGRQRGTSFYHLSCESKRNKIRYSNKMKELRIICYG